MNRLLPDLRHAFRMLLRTPGVTATALLALALAIGANTAMFSVVDAVLLRPLPYPEADRVAFIWEDASQIGFPRNTPAPANWKDWNEQNGVFTEIAATRGYGYQLTGDGPPEQVVSRRATASLWSVLGTRPMLGRTFTEAEDKSAAKVAVIGYGLWQRRYGGDPGVLGRKVLLSGEPFTVIGVMPSRFSFPTWRTEIWTPSSFTPADLARRGVHFLQCVGRLREGVTMAQARTEMRGIGKRLEAQYPDTNRSIGVVVVPIAEQVAGDSRTGLIVLFAASGFVLLIACANIANLLLARAAGRRREIAIRAVLGAGRGVIVRQLLTESLLLAGLGAILGIALAGPGMKGLERLIPVEMIATPLTLDLRVLAFTSLAAVFTGLLFGGFLDFSLGRDELHESLRQGGRTLAGDFRHYLRDGLVVSQTALALALLTAAGLMIQTLYNLQHTDLGLRTDHLLTLTTDLARTRYPEHAQREAFLTSVLAKVRALPGVAAAGYTSALPLTTVGNTNGYIVEGQTQVKANTQDALFRVVTPGFHETMEARPREGRFFSDDDRASTLPVVIINETFANRHWPGQSPLGKRIDLQLNELPRWLTIVGVVKEIRERGINIETKPAVYMALAQAANYWPIPSDLAIRTAVEPLALLPAVRQAIWSVDKDQPLTDIRTMNDVVDEELGSQNRQMLLLGGFALLALVLAVTGIYGVISYVVAQRRREIGVRIALGAVPPQILAMVFRDGGRLIVGGLVLGIALSLAEARMMSALLYGVRPQDPATVSAAAMLLALVGFAACAIPARAASVVDPAIVLRDE